MLDLRVEVGTPYPETAWVDTPPFKGYEISNYGHLRNKKTGRVLCQRVAGNGALQVSIGRATWMVHTLVLRSFTGHALTRGYFPRHCNGDKSDNRLENLVWAYNPRSRG